MRLRHSKSSARQPHMDHISYTAFAEEELANPIVDSSWSLSFWRCPICAAVNASFETGVAYPWGRWLSAPLSQLKVWRLSQKSSVWKSLTKSNASSYNKLYTQIYTNSTTHSLGVLIHSAYSFTRPSWTTFGRSLKRSYPKNCLTLLFQTAISFRPLVSCPL